MKSGWICFSVFGFGQVGGGFSLSQTVALETDAVGVVDDTIQNGICDRGLADHVVPFDHGQLGGDQRGFSAIALLEDFQKIEALLIVEGMGAPIVQDQQLDASELVK